MKPFWDNLELVINKYLSTFYSSFLSIEYISNKQVLSGKIIYNSSYNYIPILFEFYFNFVSDDNFNFNEFVDLIAFKRLIWYKGMYESFNKFCIGCMAAYTYGDYIYLKIYYYYTLWIS